MGMQRNRERCDRHTCTGVVTEQERPSNARKIEQVRREHVFVTRVKEAASVCRVAILHPVQNFEEKIFKWISNFFIDLGKLQG